jgi:hypothetical protein
LTKLVIDYPTKYTECSYGDVTFVLAHLYLKDTTYRSKINYLKHAGRELMLDNGAWEFGSSMRPDDYIKIIQDLEPTYAVIPDVYKNQIESERMTREFMEKYDSEPDTQLMFVPQGNTVEEVFESYNNLVTDYGTFFDILAIAKHIGTMANRVSFTDTLVAEAFEPPHDVHFLGFWSWEELEQQRFTDWKLVSIDTKKPVKNAYLPETFTSQLDYYNTDKILNLNAFQIEVNEFYVKLNELGWIND